MSIVCLVIAAVVFLGDWIAKRRIEEVIQPGAKKELLGGRIVLRRSYNKGMALNLLDSRPRLVKLIRVILVITLTVWFLKTLFSADPAWKKIGLAIVTGGAWNNVLDYLKNGTVTDYISFGKGKVVFNLSDFALIGGCIFMIIRTLQE